MLCQLVGPKKYRASSFILLGYFSHRAWGSQRDAAKLSFWAENSCHRKKWFCTFWLDKQTLMASCKNVSAVCRSYVLKEKLQTSFVAEFYWAWRRYEGWFWNVGHRLILSIDNRQAARTICFLRMVEVKRAVCYVDVTLDLLRRVRLQQSVRSVEVDNLLALLWISRCFLCLFLCRQLDDSLFAIAIVLET